MTLNIQQSIFSEVADFIVSQPSLKEIVDYKLSDDFAQELATLESDSHNASFSEDSRKRLQQLQSLSQLIQLVNSKAVGKIIEKYDRAKDEYIDVSNNMRIYINIRFAQLTLFIATMAGILTTVLRTDLSLPEPFMMLLKVLGLLFVWVFYVMEHRGADIYHYYKRRAQELEKTLGYKQYTDRLEAKYSATLAVRLFFAVIGFSWILAIFADFWNSFIVKIIEANIFP